MLIGDRIRAFREAKEFSQGDIEARTGLKRPYISRIENNHTVPALETLEKFARALEVPLYQLFYEGEKPPDRPNLRKRLTADHLVKGMSKEEAVFLEKLCGFFSRMDEADRLLLLCLAQKMARC